MTIFYKKKRQTPLALTLVKAKGVLYDFVKNSTAIKMRENIGDFYRIDSVEKSRLFRPRLPKYRIELKLEDDDLGCILYIKIKGNILTSLYSVLLLLLSFISIFLFYEGLEFVGVFVFLQMLIGSFLFRSTGKKYVKSGELEVKRLEEYLSNAGNT